VIADIARISAVGYLSFLVFLGVVLVGFYYEWAIGLLNWVPSKANNVELHFPNTLIENLPLSLVLLYIDPIFLILWALILSSLLCNFLKNLIYRVINLAFLSILVVSMWAYFTDFTFIYIVYILAFVGAVIMLFLSVILMLPSSVITDPQKQMNFNSAGLLIVVIELNNNNQQTSLVAIFMVLLLINLVLLTGTPRAYRDIQLFFDAMKVEFGPIFSKLYAISSWGMFVNVVSELWGKLLQLFGFNTDPSIFMAYFRNPLNYASFPTLATPGLLWQNFLYYVYINIEVPLYGGFSKEMYKYTSPVWNKTFMVFEYGYASAKYINDRFPIPELRKPYSPLPLKFSLFQFLPFTLDLSFFKYLPGNNVVTRYINRSIFAINFVWFFSIMLIYNICLRFYIWGVVNFEIISQLLSAGFIITAAIPINGPSSAAFDWKSSLLSYSETDGLLAIKIILYEANFMYLFLSVIGLLIALIGSAIFTRHIK